MKNTDQLEYTTYACAICGPVHNNVLDRANCEIECAKRIAEEAQKAAEAKKQAEKNERKAEVDAAFEMLHKLMTAFVKDYGHYEYDGETTNFAWPSKLYHRLWF